MESSSGNQQSSLGLEIKDLEESTVRAQLRKIKELTSALKESELEVFQLKRDVSSLRSYQEQCENLRAQLNLCEEKIEHYKHELHEKSRNIQDMEYTMRNKTLSDLAALRQEIGTKDRQIHELRTELDERKQLYDNESTLNQLEKNNLEQQITRLNEITQQQLAQLHKLAENAKEAKQKDIRLTQIERYNSELSEQIVELNLQVKQYEEKLQMIPKFKNEIKASGDLILRASNELENEKKKYALLQKQFSQASTKLKESSSNQEQTDEYIEQLRAQLEDSKQNYSLIQADVNALEAKQKKYEKQVTVSKKAVAAYIESLGKWIDLHFFNGNEEATQVFPKAPDFGGKFKEVSTQAEVLRNSLLEAKTSSTLRIRGLEKQMRKFTHDKENVSSELRKKVKQLSQHVEKQEELYRNLISQRDATTTEHREASEQLEAMQGKYAIAKERVRELEVELEGVQRSLQEAGVQSSGSVAADVGTALASLAQYSSQYAGEISGLRADNEELRETLETEKAKFEQASMEYYSRVNNMNKQIERLNAAVDHNEENQGAVLSKCKAYEQQLANASNVTAKREAEFERVIQILVRTLAPLLRNACDLAAHKRFLQLQVARSESVLTAAYKAAGVRRSLTGISKFRAALIAVLAFNRFRRIGQGRSTAQRLVRSGVTFNGVSPQMAEIGIPNFKLPTFVNDYEILNSVIYSMEAFIERPSYTLFNQNRILTSRAPVNLGQLFQDLQGELAKCRDEIVYLHSSATTKTAEQQRIESELRMSTEKLAALESNLSQTVGREEYELLSGQLKAMQATNSELAAENDQAAKSVTDLHNASLRLQEHINLLLTQQNDYIKDIELKTKHIETLEDNVQRMNNRLKSEEQARLVSDSMSETVNDKLSSLRDDLKVQVDQVHFLRKELDEAREQHSELQDVINGLKADIKVKDIEIDILKTRRDISGQLNAQLQWEMESYENGFHL